MPTIRYRLLVIPCCVALYACLVSTAAAATLCVNPHNTACYSSIQAAVNHASAGDTVNVAPGTYDEFVTIGIPISLVGWDNRSTIIDAGGLPHGIFIDGVDNPGLSNVNITGLTVENALYEGILIVSASNVTISNDQVNDNDTSPGLVFTGATTGCPGQPGTGVYENDETGDCGGAIHLIGVSHSIVSDNYITGNADGVLISDETAESHDNMLLHNQIVNNPLECGIVLASHPPNGYSAAPYGPHFGVDHNTVAENVSMGNGVEVGGSGVGIFSDGNGAGTVVGNVILRNTLVGNGLGGVAIHTHVGPAFGLPADNFSGNVIIGNYIAKNLADTADTATPGTVGININSGGGGSPIQGTVVSDNTIEDEQFDIAVNTPSEVDIHLNNLDGGKVGVGDVCAYDSATICTGSIDASENYWGCAKGPGAAGCSTVSGTDIEFVPWLGMPVSEDDTSGRIGPFNPIVSRESFK